MDNDPSSNESLDEYVEKRRWTRYACISRAVMSNEFIVSWPALILNVSRGGIGFELRERLDDGTPLVLELHNSSTGQTLPERVARVTHAAEREEIWVIGAEFEEELNDDELDLLRAGDDPASDGEEDAETTHD